MFYIRGMHECDVERIVDFEINISVISFGEKAITNRDFQRRKILSAKDKSGMMVISSGDSQKVFGWLWMEKKKNSLTGETYINFKSFYIAEEMRGNELVDALFEKGIEYSKSRGASYIVGKVHAQNLPMRALYKNHCFLPTHITMELSLENYD